MQCTLLYHTIVLYTIKCYNALYYIVLCYAVFKSPELNNPFDPESGQTGNILYGLTEIYNGPEGVQAHMELGQSRAEMFSELVSLTNEYSVCAILGAPVIRSM